MYVSHKISVKNVKCFILLLELCQLLLLLLFYSFERFSHQH